MSAMDMIVPFGDKAADTVRDPVAGDWRCIGCNSLMLAKYPNCRKCGEARPQSADLQVALTASTELALAPLNPAMSPIIAKMNQGEDWQCPLCKETSFNNRSTCRRCGCPRPEGPLVVQTVTHQLQNGGYIGYLPDPNKIEATSSWAKQWSEGPPPGAMQLNTMQMIAPAYDPKSSSSSSSSSSLSSSSSSSSESEAMSKKKQKVADADANKKPKSSSSGASSDAPAKKKKKKVDVKEKKEKGKTKEKADQKADKVEKDSGDSANEEEDKIAAKKAKKEAKAAAKAKLQKKRSKAMDVDQELEKRRLQRERRKSRIVNLA